MRVAIIGAGPAGLTAGLELSRRGVPVVVYEAGEHVGGMSRSFELWGQTVDVGPHRFFSLDERVKSLWSDLLGDDRRVVRRRTRIRFRGRFIEYPLRPLNALGAMGVVEATRCLASFCAAGLVRRARGDDEESFESLMVRRFGRRLFETFFRSYSEKVWGVSCGRLSADFAEQRIRGFSLSEAVRATWSTAVRRRHATVADGFDYPLSGAGEVYRRMARRIEGAGGQVRLRSPVESVLTHDGGVVGVRMVGGAVEPHDRVVSTMPLPMLLRGLAGVPADVQSSARRLRYRHAAIVYLHVAASDLFPDQWVYVHSPDVRMGRVTNFRNWVPEITRGSSSTILAVEYWHDDGDALALADERAMATLAERDLRATGLLGSEPVTDGFLLRVPGCYPVYELGYRREVARIAAWLAECRGLTVIGRGGAFKYNNQDHSMLMGLQAADNIMADRTHDLWAVNTDYSRYQEEETAR